MRKQAWYELYAQACAELWGRCFLLQRGETVCSLKHQCDEKAFNSSSSVKMLGSCELSWGCTEGAVVGLLLCFGSTAVGPGSAWFVGRMLAPSFNGKSFSICE